VHVNYEEDKNKVPMNKPYNIQNTNICNGIFHISFFKALLINEGEATRGETTQGVNGSPRYPCGQDTACTVFNIIYCFTLKESLFDI
jgi:hypothetical protein